MATDLSPRCDRALDRAVALADDWAARLVIVHVLEDVLERDRDPKVVSWRQPPDPVSLAARRLYENVGPVIQKAEVVIAEGDPAEVIARMAAERECDCIVTGTARDEILGRFFLGTTVDRLLRKASQPVLIVRSRPRGPYKQIGVALSFDVPSRHALETALRLFPRALLTGFHAYEASVSGLLANSDQFLRERRETVTEDYRAFLRTVTYPGPLDERVRAFIELGTPAELMRQGVRDLGIELVVTGTRGRSAFIEALIGSVAREIRAEVPCDVLVVRDPPRGGDD